MVSAREHDDVETIAQYRGVETPTPLCWRNFKTIALQVRKRQRLVARRAKKYPRR